MDEWWIYHLCLQNERITSKICTLSAMNLSKPTFLSLQTVDKAFDNSSSTFYIDYLFSSRRFLQFYLVFCQGERSKLTTKFRSRFLAAFAIKINIGHFAWEDELFSCAWPVSTPPCWLHKFFYITILTITWNEKNYTISLEKKQGLFA